MKKIAQGLPLKKYIGNTHKNGGIMDNQSKYNDRMYYSFLLLFTALAGIVYYLV